MIALTFLSEGHRVLISWGQSQGIEARAGGHGANLGVWQLLKNRCLGIRFFLKKHVHSL